MKLGTKLLLAPLLTGAIALAGGGLNAVLMGHQATAAIRGWIWGFMVGVGGWGRWVGENCTGYDGARQ